MKTFSMSKYANEADLYKAKAEYYAGLSEQLLEACKLALRAFENNDCIDWGVIEKAIDEAKQ